MKKLIAVAGYLLLLLVSLPLQAQLAEGKCKFLGNIIAGSEPSDFLDYWNQVTPENSGKWGSVESARDVMNWSQLDIAYHTAKDNGLPFKQHNFVWGQQQPAWIDDIEDAEEVKAEVEEWIQAFCERYPETDFIDVVNEPLHAKPSYRIALGGEGTTGWDWAIWVFEKAREYCPNAKLILNEYNTISYNNETNAYLALINILKDRNLIDIIGEQGHSLEGIATSTLTSNLNKLAETGLPIHISELDIDIASDNGQLTEYQELFPLLWQHPGVHGITLWGYREGQIWRPNAFLINSNNTQRPAMTWLTDYVSENTGGTFCVTGISGGELSDAAVYPNPVFDGNLRLELGPGKFDVQLVDLSGKVKQKAQVLNQQYLELQLNESPGLYILHVSGAKGKFFKKIMVR